MKSKSNLACVNAYASVCEELSRKSPEVRQTIHQTTDRVFELLSSYMFASQDNSVPFSERLDIAVAESLATIMNTFIQIDVVPFLNS